MSDPNPVIRARALEAFRRTVGLEMSGGVNVNVNLRTTVSSSSQQRKLSSKHFLPHRETGRDLPSLRRQKLHYFGGFTTT